MASLRAAFTSLALLRSSASTERLSLEEADSSTLQSGQRLAKPGLSGFSSNSSPQTAQALMGNAIYVNDNTMWLLAARLLGGHGFSRAVTPSNKSGALAPEALHPAPSRHAPTIADILPPGQRFPRRPGSGVCIAQSARSLRHHAHDGRRIRVAK